MSDTRHRLVPASDPGADPACRLTAEEGHRRETDTDKLFAQLAEQRPTAPGNEVVLPRDPEALSDYGSPFRDDDAQCCPCFPSGSL